MIILLAHYAKTQNEIELIEKTEEGKHVLDTIYLQSGLSGKNLNINTIKAGLNNLAGHIRDDIKVLGGARKANAAACKADIGHVDDRYHDISSRALALTRVRKGAEKRQARRERFAKRAGQELSNYMRYRAMMNGNHEAWKKVYSRATTTIKKVLGLMHKAREALHNYRPKSGAAFVELPETYSASLSEIKHEFSSTFDNLDGLRPLIADLLQVISSAEALKDKSARQKIREFLYHLTERLEDKLAALEEQNEHQEGLFTSLSTMFGDAVKRANGVLTQLEKGIKIGQTKINYLKQGELSANALAKSAHSIVLMKKQECGAFVAFLSHERIRHQKILDVISELQGVIADRWGVLNSFFVQKIEETSE